MAVPEISINYDQLYAIGEHAFCKLSMDEYKDSKGNAQVCIECDTCGKVLVRLNRRLNPRRKK